MATVQVALWVVMVLVALAILFDFMNLIETLEQEEIARLGKKIPDFMTVTREAEDGSEIEMVVMRNDAANALVARADLSHRLSAAVPVESGEALAQARSYEDRLTALLQKHEEGCCTHVVLEQGIRTVSYQVANPAAALAHARSLEAGAGLPVTLDVAFEPDWKAYRVWLD